MSPFTESSFTGGRFGTLGTNDPHRFGGDDIVAVSCLSVDIPARAALHIIDDVDGQVGANLPFRRLRP